MSNEADRDSAALRRPFLWRWWRKPGLILLVGVFVAGGSQLSRGQGLRLNQAAPDFVRVSLDDHRVHLAGYRGKVVLLNFWATWCAPCLEEMPRFSELQKQYNAQGLQVLGVSMDDDPVPARRIEQKLNLGYPVVMGDEKLGAQYGGVLGLPVSFLIDRKGRVRARFQGETDLKKIEERVKALLETPRKAVSHP